MKGEKDKFKSIQHLPYGRPLEWGETVKHEEESPLFPKNLPPINDAWQLFLIIGFPFYCWLFAVIAINYFSHSTWNKYVQDGGVPFLIASTVFIICAFLVPIVHALMRNSERVVITDRRIFYAPSAYARPEYRSVFRPLGNALGLEVQFKYTLSVTIERHYKRPCLVFQAYNPNWSITDDDGPVKEFHFYVFDPQSVYDHLPAYLRVQKVIPDSLDGSYEKLKQWCEEHLAQRE
jgi:hypothetical protein